jgi:hypothetical protein
VRRADEVARRLAGRLEQCLGLGQGRRHRLLDQDVLAGLEAGAGDLAVLVHAGQHEHRVDLVVLDHGAPVGDVRAHVPVLGGPPLLVRVDVTDGRDVEAALAAQDGGQVGVRAAVRVRPGPDGAEPDDAEANGHGVLLATR